MLKKAKPKKPAASTSLRFAHPYYTTSLQQRLQTGGGRLLDHIKGKLQAIPKPRGEPTMTLSDVIGAQGATEIQQAEEISFHTLGDSGKGPDTPEQFVAEAMAQDYDVAHPGRSPAFLFHLGDVIYGPGKDQGYRREFYEPFVHYPGKVIAIPGNHDGEVFPTTDPTTLKAFQANFCAPSQTVPAIAGTIYRETMNQPGVYWLLDTPLVQLVGLYSNSAENPGFISGPIPGQAQLQWLVKTLQGIRQGRVGGQRKALIIATHHPPFTAGGHSPSTEMLTELDTSCTQAGIMPDLFLSGHAHSFQRYTRYVTSSGRAMEIPYIVAGTGGISDQAVPPATGARTGDHTFVKSRQGYGYLLVRVTSTQLTAKFVAVDGQTRSDFDTVTVDLGTNKLV